LRLTRASWLILALGIFVIAFASVFVVYARQASQHKDLESSLAEAQVRYPQLASQIKTLESQLAQRQSDLAAELSKLSQAKAKFPSSVPIIDYYQRLLALADDCDLSITSLTASEPRQQSADSVTYLVTTLNVAVSGDMADILDFIHTLATREDFTSATVTVVNINTPQPPSGEEGIFQESQASLTLDIYAYPGQ
jgi:hypothetical protein